MRDGFGDEVMHGMSQSSEVQLERAGSSLAWHGVQSSVVRPTVAVVEQEVDLLPEFEELLREPASVAGYVPGREGLLG
jgi:hypothetical protein